MERVREMMMWVVTMMNCRMIQLKQRVYGALAVKRAGMEGFVVAIILCIVALVLAVVFRQAIANWFNTIMAKFTTETTNLF